MGKDSRISFRLSNNLSAKVDSKIMQSAGEIRDRSEFGTKAIKFYLDYIENTDSEEKLIAGAILALAEKTNIENKLIDELGQIYEEIPSVPMKYPAKDPITHEDYDKLLGVANRYREKELDEYEELKTIISDIHYHEVSRVYEEYKEKFLQIAN